HHLNFTQPTRNHASRQMVVSARQGRRACAVRAAFSGATRGVTNPVSAIFSARYCAGGGAASAASLPSCGRHNCPTLQNTPENPNTHLNRAFIIQFDAAAE